MSFGMHSNVSSCDIVHALQDTIRTEQALTRWGFPHVHALPVTPWYGMSSALNALLLDAATRNATYVMYQSIEIQATREVTRCCGEREMGVTCDTCNREALSTSCRAHHTCAYMYSTSPCFCQNWMMKRYVPVLISKARTSSHLVRVLHVCMCAWSCASNTHARVVLMCRLVISHACHYRHPPHLRHQHSMEYTRCMAFTNTGMACDAST